MLSNKLGWSIKHAVKLFSYFNWYSDWKYSIRIWKLVQRLTHINSIKIEKDVADRIQNLFQTDKFNFLIADSSNSKFSSLNFSEKS